ncbi:tail fiber protein, partial [Morganella morganii]
IATTVPDTISDAARTMSANQGYIIYFLRAMQQWMTDTGQVEIELPNGQKVTLDSIKALNDALSNLSQKVDDIKIPELKDASINQKGIVQLTEKIGDSETLAPHQKAVRDGINALNSSIGKGLSINDN